MYLRSLTRPSTVAFVRNSLSAKKPFTSRRIMSNAEKQVSSLDGKAPDAAGAYSNPCYMILAENMNTSDARALETKQKPSIESNCPGSYPSLPGGLASSNPNSILNPHYLSLPTDYANYFCTYSFLYHQVRKSNSLANFFPLTRKDAHTTSPVSLKFISSLTHPPH